MDSRVLALRIGGLGSLPGGHSLTMFRIFKSVANPFSRMALLAFAWTHRRSVMRWGRSFWTELSRPGRIDPKRLTMIGKVLWAITRDDELAGARQLKHVRLEDDVLVVDASSRWAGKARLVDAVEHVDGIRTVTDTQGRVLTGSIDTTAA